MSGHRDYEIMQEEKPGENFKSKKQKGSNSYLLLLRLTPE